MLICSLINLVRAKKVRPAPFGKDTWVTLGFIALFCGCLYFGLPFFAVAPLFLWGLMCCLRRGHFIENALIAAAADGAVYAVFTLLLGIY